MKKVNLGILIALFVFILMIGGVAMAAMFIPAVEQAKGNAKADNAPVITKANDHWVLAPSGLERIVFIHYKKGFAKPPWAGGGKKESKCYDFLGRGVEWEELPVTYVVHPGLETTVPGAIFDSAETWDGATSVELFSNIYSVDETANWDSDAPDGRNELLFGDYPEEGVIAVTIVWGYFSGPPQLRKIVEFDVLFDTDFTWGDATVDPTVMDLQNIATHEIGHGLGLDDIYDSVCSEVTMYGYSINGETKKRTLEQPDITGLQELYGF